MRWTIFGCWFILIMQRVTLAPHNLNQQVTLAQNYMTRFGYLEIKSSNSEPESLVRMEMALKNVQRFGGIPVTGELDNATIKLMNSPRCGLPDLLPSKTSRRRRFILNTNEGWTKQVITYHISQGSYKLDLQFVKDELRKAFAAWIPHTRIFFQEVDFEPADMVIEFGTLDHGDGYPFDGPGNTLAHAFPPSRSGHGTAGDIHFDEDEVWRMAVEHSETGGTDFFSVAVHEIGHTLGLSHSDEHEAIMNPYYKYYDSRDFRISYDDILGIYQLYANNKYMTHEEETTRKFLSTTTTTTTSSITKMPSSEDPRFNMPKQSTTTPKEAVVNYIGDSETVEEHKRHDPCYSPDLDKFYSRSVPRNFSDSEITQLCHGPFDAIAVFRGEIMFFREQFVWRLTGRGQFVSSTPTNIHAAFAGLPKNVRGIDAAYERPSDNNLIFFKGNAYWIYNDKGLVSNGPRSITDFGLPPCVRNINAVVSLSPTETYIISRQVVWRFDEKRLTVDADHPLSLEEFLGLPPELDGAITWTDGFTYFFQNENFWTFKGLNPATDQSSNEIANYWFGCKRERRK